MHVHRSNIGALFICPATSHPRIQTSGIKMRVLQITGLVLLWVWTGVQVATAASCSDQVSSGDKSVGISGEDAPTCPSGGGVGCFESTPCRFCMAFSTPQSSHLAACTTTTTTASSTSVSPTVTPSVAPTVAPTSTISDDDCTEALTVA
ncbi:hypothetical protein JG688_00004484 [Phytophthora aleatoria]|uniref:Uncharacterized protein n=1 Tax=Phytophthora aleatoria TaxID=2496075 RepID=A0A8J5MI06_9STRA|nr:hypothetical protein JG688_00004484 [Phytophthora aleatoria]